MFDFSNRVVIVTGAAGNLGIAVAKAFQAAGAKLAAADRADDRLRGIFQDIVNSPDHLLLNSIDANDPASVERMVNETVGRFGQIDVLVNTVGGYRAGTPVHETPIETWDFMLSLNARTVFIVCRAVIPHMLKRGYGKIVNVAARPALSGAEKMAAYSASKSALMRLTESMSAELKGKGINVNCVLPSTIDTPQNRQSMPKADHSRWVTPEAIADVILFLASEAARAVHGAGIPVYGRS